MAVIREKRQFQVGPIGVARVADPIAGSNAGGTIANAVAQSADQMADLLFRAGAQQAEKVGLEQGATSAREEILTIDPITGAPKAYEPPQGFGKIASEAYQRVIMSRFQASMEEEIKLKARELAVKYDGSVDRYSEAMSQYIGAMAQNAQGQFKTYITDVGTGYLNATRSAMAIDQIRRERAAAAAAQKAAISEGLNAIEFMVAQGGPQSIAGDAPTPATVTGQSVDIAMKDAADAQLFSAEDLASLGSKRRAAVVRGLIRHAGKGATDPDTLRLLKGAIGSQNPAMIPEEFGYLREAIASFGSDYSGLASVEKFADGFLNDAIAVSEVVQKREVEQIKAAQAMTVFDINADAEAFKATARSASSADVRLPSAVASQAGTDYQQQTELARSALAAGREEESKAILKARDTRFEGYVEGLELRAVKGLTRDQTLAVERAVMERNPTLAPASAQESVAAILRLEAVKPGLSDGFLSFVGQYREGAGKAVEIEREANAFAAVNDATSQTAIALMATPSNTDSLVEQFRQGLSGISGLKPEDRKRAEAEISYRAGVSHMSQFFLTNPSEEAIDRAMSYVATGTDDGTLTPSQRASLDKVRQYGVDSGRESELRTQFSIMEDRAAAMRAEKQRDTDRQLAVTRIQSGMVNPGSSKDRQVYEDVLQETYSNLLNGKSIADVIADPSSVGRAEYAPIFNDMVNRNILPQSLFDSFASTANGGVTGAQAISALRIWGNVRTKTDPMTGAEMLSPAIGALSQDQIATLDMLYDVGRMSGESPEVLAQTINSINRYKQESTFKQRVENALEQPLDAFLFSLEGMDAAPPSAYNQLAAAALNLIASSPVTNYTPDQIKTRLQRQLEQSYPDGGGIVYNSSYGSRTHAALSRTVPGAEDLFKQHVIRSVVSDGFDPSGEKINGARFTAGMMDFLRGGTAFQRGMGEKIFLQPTGSEAGAITYRVMLSRSVEDGGPVPVYQMIDAEGQRIPVPMYIRTDDPSFRSAVMSRASQRQTTDIQAEERRQQSILETSQQPMP